MKANNHKRGATVGELLRLPGVEGQPRKSADEVLRAGAALEALRREPAAGEQVTRVLRQDLRRRAVQLVVGGREVLVRPGTVELVNHPGAPYDYRVRVELEESPRPHLVVAELAVIARPGGDPVTARRVQQVPVGHVTRSAIAALVEGLVDGRPGVLPHGVGDGVATQAADKVATRPSPARTSRITATEHKRCAEAYKAAQRAGRPVGVAVAAALRVEPGTARQRVRLARKAGYLAPAEGRGRGGPGQAAGRSIARPSRGRP